MVRRNRNTLPPGADYGKIRLVGRPATPSELRSHHGVGESLGGAASGDRVGVLLGDVQGNVLLQRTLSQTTHDRSMYTKRKRAAAGIPAFFPHRI